MHLPLRISIHKKTCLSAFLALMLLPGCGQQPSYKLLSLEPQSSYDQVTKQTETGPIAVRCNTCSRQYVRQLFGKQGDALFGLRSHRRIIPIQIYIQNNSSTAWTLSPYDIHLPQADFDNVKGRFLKAAGCKSLASFSIGTACGVGLVSFGSAASIFNPIIGGSIFGLGCAILFGTPLITHKKAEAIGAQNMRYEMVLENMSLRDTICIHPGEQLNTLIFVQKNNLESCFDLRLTNKLDSSLSLLYQLNLNI